MGLCCKILFFVAFRNHSSCMTGTTFSCNLTCFMALDTCIHIWPSEFEIRHGCCSDFTVPLFVVSCVSHFSISDFTMGYSDMTLNTFNTFTFMLIMGDDKVP